jgi:hypothetical protein
MRVSDLIGLTHRALAMTCAASVTLAAMPELGFATDLAAATGLAAEAEVHVARERQGSRVRPSSSRKGSADTRRRDRPSASSRYPRGSAAGSLSRPAPGFNRGNRVPSSGWVNKTPPGSLRPARPPLRPRPDRPDRPDWNRPSSNRPNWNRPGSNRPDWNRPGSNRPNWDRPGWDRPNWNRPGWNRPSWVFNRPVQINNIYGRPGWWGPGWSSSRPWSYGWYNGGYNRWNWWNSSSVIWGITSLASAAIIGAAINNALQQDRPTIVVKDSPYELVFGSVNAVNSDEVVFTFLMGDGSYEARANCRAGTLNGRKPVNPEEAQLMNAACQVAFSNF